MKMRLVVLLAVAVFAVPVYAQSRVPGVDETANLLDQHVIGNKEDTEAIAASSTSSIMAYLKGALTQTRPAESAGTSDIDVSEYAYTSYVTLLTVAPAASASLARCVVVLDLDKATTGFNAVATDADTIDVIAETKVDGTNWRVLEHATQVAAATPFSGAVNGVRIDCGMIGVSQDLRIRVKLSAERADVEIPYRVIYQGKAPTVTAVAAG